jgi:hypothetical protein
MQQSLSCTRLAFALLLTAGTAFPQQTAQDPAAPRRYSSSIYLKVPADKQAALVAFYKTGAGAKAIRARMKANSNFTGWSLRQVMYPGEHGSDANFVIMSASIGAPASPDADPAKRDELYRSATGMTYEQYMATVRGMSEQVGSSLAHVHHSTEGFALTEGDIVVANRLKTAQGKSQELSNLVRDVQFPLMADRVKSGGRMKAWAWGHLTFPSGSALPWDATATSVYKNLEDALPQTNTGSAAAAHFAKLFPTRNYLGYMDDLREFAKPVRVDIYRIMVSIRP